MRKLFILEGIKKTKQRKWRKLMQSRIFLKKKKNKTKPTTTKDTTPCFLSRHVAR